MIEEQICISRRVYGNGPLGVMGQHPNNIKLDRSAIHFNSFMVHNSLVKAYASLDKAYIAKKKIPYDVIKEGEKVTKEVT